MAFRKRKVGVVVDNARIRLDAMKQIDIEEAATINYGSVANPLMKVEFEAQIKKIETANTLHNQQLETADTTGSIVKDEQDILRKMYTQVLKGGVSEFGEDSTQVEKLGGTRHSERKRPKRKPPTP